MEKEKFSLARIYFIFIFLVSIFFYSHTGFAQCTNPDTTGESSQTFCKSDNSTIESLVASGGTIVWFDAITAGSQYNPSTPLIDGNTYYADDINDGNCSPNRLAVLVSIYGQPPSNVDVFVGKCAIDNPTISDLSATGLNIAWYDAQSGGNLFNSSDLLIDGSTYWVQQTENGCTSERLPTTVTMVNPPAPNVDQNQTFCSSSNPTVADLKATETNITWYEYETSTEPLNLNLPLIDGKDYWAAQTTFPCEGTVRSLTNVVIDISPNAGTDGTYSECEANLTATNLFELLGGTPDNTGTWSGPSTLTGGYLGTFEPGVNTEGTYTYLVSSSIGICPNDTSNVNVSIITTPPPTAIETSQTFCEVDNPTVANLNATGNGILWYDTGSSSIPLNVDDILINGEDYWATQTDTSGCESSTRLMVTASIISPQPPTTTETNQTFCEVDNPTVADLNATGNGVLWYDTETSTSALNDTDSLINGEDYWATQTDTNGCSSATRLAVTTSIISTPPPTTSESNQTFCEVDNPTVA
ncbi:Ig-like domain-containing protein, partial [Lutibacter flavus]